MSCLYEKISGCEGEQLFVIEATLCLIVCVGTNCVNEVLGPQVSRPCDNIEACRDLYLLFHCFSYLLFEDLAPKVAEL